MFALFFILSAAILIYGIYTILKKSNIESDYIKDENSDNYLYAKEVFVRDPESFHDKDHNGIDDIIDQEKK